MKAPLISHDWADRLVHAHDASVYRMVPQAVARPSSVQEVRQLMDWARAEHCGLTFRAGGTSLSGQAVTDGLLVVLGRAWETFTVEDAGRLLTCGPALRGAVANAALARFGRRIGPDPASLQAACMGGIVANNASGMCCGIEENSYRTIAGMNVLLATGTQLDTRRPDCDEFFRFAEPDIYTGLLALRDRVLSSGSLVDLIRRKSAGKNTTGYSLQAFLDCSTASDLLTRLLVGSEGTLAFMADMTLRTVDLRPHRASALLMFEQMDQACELTPRLRELGFSAIELLDWFSVKAIEGHPHVPAFLRDMSRSGACLLLQAQEQEPDALADVLDKAREIAGWSHVKHRTDFFADTQKQSELWDLRKGIFPAAGARRPRGTSVIIEDVAFSLPQLAAGTRALRQLLEKHAYDDAVIYGHARDGNLHFILSQNFSLPSEVQRYEKFINEMVDCVALRFGGALKAEHGTGRNMAPFVETEWGSEAYSVMRAVKSLLDPENIFNPGVLINANPRVHLQNLKNTPIVDEIFDACIECGFCEPVCPSQGHTLSPRGRIVLEREKFMSQQCLPVDDAALRYAQLDTCAADGLCAKACPVGINTGSWVKQKRADNATPMASMMAGMLASEMPAVEWTTRASLRGARWASRVIGTNTLVQASGQLNKLLGSPVLPASLLNAHTGHGAAAETKAETRGGQPADTVSCPLHDEKNRTQFVVMRTCVSRQLAADHDAMRVCARRAGVDVVETGEVGTCCGQPWSSKGFPAEAKKKAQQWIERCFEVSRGGSVPVVVDNSPCAYAPFEDIDSLDPDARDKLQKLQIWDPVDFALHLAGRLHITPFKEPSRFFPVCSVVKSGRQQRFEKLARLMCEKPVFPLQVSCCGMAGDRGLWFPELSRNATERLAWGEDAAAQGFCTSRTCELGLSREGLVFDSVYVALEMASREVSEA